MVASPSQMQALRLKMIPQEVQDAWDALIARHFNGRTACVKQDDVIEMLLPMTPGASRQEVFDSGWLDIEDLYRAAGWKVSYDKPAYCESYPATFTFTA